MSFSGEFNIDAPKAVIVGEQFKATLTATNERGAPCKVPHEHLHVGVEPSHGSPRFVAVRDAVEITYTPQRTGVFTLIIKAFNKSVFDWRVEVTGPVDPKKSFAEVSSAYFVNKRGKITIVPCDSAGTPVKATSPDVEISHDGPGEIEDMKIEELADGNLGLFFIAKKPGNYEIGLKIGGIHLKNSPLKLDVA